MEVKYVHLKDGTLLIFSKYIGLQHAEMASIVCGAGVTDIADAGFIDLYEGKFEVYGKSISLGVEADGRTNRILNETVDSMKVYDLNSTCRWFAINRDVGEAATGVPLELVGSGLDGMRQFKIL